MEKLQQVVKGLLDLKKVVVIFYVFFREKIDFLKIFNSVFLDDFFVIGISEQVLQLEFEQLFFSYLLFIMFLLGIMGVFKCMVYFVGGIFIQYLKEYLLYGNMIRSDIFLCYIMVGWMMWNWMVFILVIGVVMVLYDGFLLVFMFNVFWDLVDRIGIIVLVIGVKWLLVLEEKVMKLVEIYSFQMFYMILFIGFLLKVQSYEYVYRCIKSSIFLGFILGGIDIIFCFMGYNFFFFVYKGEIQVWNLGMVVEVWNEEGKVVWGESGELVCIKLIFCQFIYFWNDENGNKYRKVYFFKFLGIWVYGDYCRINFKIGGIIMFGWSDGIFNFNGVWFGSLEIYNIVEFFEEVEDSLCVFQYNKYREERVIFFLKMVFGYVFQFDLVKRICDVICVGLFV